MYMNGIPPSPPIEKTPLVGAFFIGRAGEPLEISASCMRDRLNISPGAACPERSEEVQYLSISANQVHNSDVVGFFFCYQRIFGGLGVRFEVKTGRFGFDGKRDANRLGDENERKWGKNGRKTCE